MQTTEDILHIRMMISKDFPQIIHIEQFYHDPWSINDFKKYLKQPRNLGLVAVNNEQIFGYALFQILPKYFDIHKISVHPNSRRQCIGSKLVHKIINKPFMHNRTFVNAHIPESNLTTQLFLKSLNFKATQIIKTEKENFYLMQYHAS